MTEQTDRTNCAHCDFWESTDHDSPGQALVMGLCRRNSPRPAIDELAWPITSVADWCGDSRKRSRVITSEKRQAPLPSDIAKALDAVYCAHESFSDLNSMEACAQILRSYTEYYSLEERMTAIIQALRRRPDSFATAGDMEWVIETIRIKLLR